METKKLVHTSWRLLNTIKNVQCSIKGGRTRRWLLIKYDKLVSQLKDLIDDDNFVEELLERFQMNSPVEENKITEPLPLP